MTGGSPVARARRAAPGFLLISVGNEADIGVGEDRHAGRRPHTGADPAALETLRDADRLA